jgi:acyl carrier protein
MNQNNKIKIIEIISKIAKINLDQINESTSINDFSKWDSLAHLQIMLEIEKKFQIKISTSKMSELDSVIKIIKFVDSN